MISTQTITTENPFSRVIAILTESATLADSYNDWAVFAINCILKEVDDPVTRMKMLKYNNFVNNLGKFEEVEG